MSATFLPLVLVLLSPPAGASAAAPAKTVVARAEKPAARAANPSARPAPRAAARPLAARVDRPAPSPARRPLTAWTTPLDENGLFVLASAGGVTPKGLGMGSGSTFRLTAGWSFGRVAAEASVMHAELAAPAAAAVSRVQQDELSVGTRIAVLRADGGRAEGLLLASASPRATVRCGDVWYQGFGANVGGGMRIQTEHGIFLDAEARWNFVRLTSGQTQETGFTERHRFARPKTLDGLAVLVGAGVQF